jgi:hypothetical protein
MLGLEVALATKRNTALVKAQIVLRPIFHNLAAEPSRNPVRIRARLNDSVSQTTAVNNSTKWKVSILVATLLVSVSAVVASYKIERYLNPSSNIPLSAIEPLPAKFRVVANILTPGLGSGEYQLRFLVIALPPHTSNLTGIALFNRTLANRGWTTNSKFFFSRNGSIAIDENYTLTRLFGQLPWCQAELRHAQ